MRAALISLAVLAPFGAPLLGQAPVRPNPPPAAPAAAAAPARPQTAAAQSPPVSIPGVQTPTETSVPAPQVIGWIRAGQSREGRLDLGDYRMGDGTLADVWYFDGTQGQRIAIALRTGDYDGYMQLLDPYGAKLAETSVRGGHDVELMFQLPAAGRFQIVVNSAGSDPHTGTYTLSLKAGPPAR